MKWKSEEARRSCVHEHTRCSVVIALIPQLVEREVVADPFEAGLENDTQEEDYGDNDLYSKDSSASFVLLKKLLAWRK